MSRTTVITLAVGLLASCLTGCASTTSSSAPSPSGAVTVTNCGRQQTFPSPVQRMFVNDSNMIAMTLAIGAGSQVAGVTSLGSDKPHLESVYGHDLVRSLPDKGDDHVSLEKVLGARPDMVFAGYNYGYSEANNFMPEMLRAKSIAPYVLSESCRPNAGNTQRGTMDPWLALRTDLTNLGAITGHADRAKEVVDDIDGRLARLGVAPRPSKKPVVLLYDSGKDTVFTSGSFGAPQGIIDAAGATNLAADVHDSWVKVSWEKVAAAKPDFVAIVDYPGATVAQKVHQLEANPATRNLPAVKERRYVALPYLVWTSSPLNIDAAESLRSALEARRLVPKSTIRPAHQLATTPR